MPKSERMHQESKNSRITNAFLTIGESCHERLIIPHHLEVYFYEVNFWGLFLLRMGQIQSAIILKEGEVDTWNLGKYNYEVAMHICVVLVGSINQLNPMESDGPPSLRIIGVT